MISSGPVSIGEHPLIFAAFKDWQDAGFIYFFGVAAIISTPI
jgi:hypothetical protein